MKRVLRALLIAVIVIAGLGGAALYVAYGRLHETYKGYTGAETFVDIPAGAGPSSIGQRLVDAGVVRDLTTFRAAVWLSGHARDLKAGEYQFAEPMSVFAVVDKIAQGEVYGRLVTFREGLTIREMAAVYENAKLGPRADFEAAARNTALLQGLDPDAKDLEGYLFQETYTLRRNTPAPVLVEQMTSLFLKTFTPELREAAKAQGLSIREAVTVASLVEKETAVAAERPLVAAVYLNRRRIGMPMQADPTVIFALERAGRYDGNLRRDDLQFDSPYNTYRYPGLPPGPIAAPGKASLEAAVAPARVDYLYFVSRNDGSHVFAETLTEHNRNVQEWQIEYFRRKRDNDK
jgi:UPF0755 protein